MNLRKFENYNLGSTEIKSGDTLIYQVPRDTLICQVPRDT